MIGPMRLSVQNPRHPTSAQAIAPTPEDVGTHAHAAHRQGAFSRASPRAQGAIPQRGERLRAPLAVLEQAEAEARGR